MFIHFRHDFMKKVLFFLTLCAWALTNVGCDDSDDKGGEVVYDTSKINFTGRLDGDHDVWEEESEISVFAFCTRDGNQDTPMSVNNDAKYIVTESNPIAKFTNSTERDAVSTGPKDQDLRIFACFPYATTSDAKSVPVEVPARQSYPEKVTGFYTASCLLPTASSDVELEFHNIFAFLKFKIPGDLFGSTGSSVVKEMTLKPVVEGNMLDALAVKGTFDLTTGTLNAVTESREITVDFGENGLTLSEDTTAIQLLVNPFTIPESGFEVTVFDDKDDKKSQIILDSEEDKGHAIEAGSEFCVGLDPFVEPVEGVTFPVTFPLGFEDGVSVFSQSTQPRWEKEGVWECRDQPQAFAQWHYVSDNEPLLAYMDKVKDDLGSPQIGNIWTDDYLEFTLPVTDFAAGTTVRLNFEIYTRQGPVFWNIEYDDGTETKCNKTMQTSYDGKYSCECTFALHHGDDDEEFNIITHDMKFEHGIKNGYLKFRIKCADGTVQASKKKVTEKRTEPYSNSKNGAPFYFRKEGSEMKAITISIVPAE